MSKNDEFLFKQLDELYKMRKENIDNTGAASNAFLTFLSFIFAGLAIFWGDGDIPCWNKFFVLLFAGIFVFCYGSFIRKHIWISHINQVKYTRKMNMTRRYLARGTKAYRQDQVLLPIDNDKPGFDVRGTVGDYSFSKHDAPNWIKWINTISFATILFVASYLFCLFPFRISSCKLSIHDFPCDHNWYTIIYNSMAVAIFGGLVMFIKQEADDENFVSKAVDEWNKEIKNYDNF